jgi:hypothetical protein
MPGHVQQGPEPVAPDDRSRDGDNESHRQENDGCGRPFPRPPVEIISHGRMVAGAVRTAAASLRNGRRRNSRRIAPS